MRCSECGFMIRGKNHKDGTHHKTMRRAIQARVNSTRGVGRRRWRDGKPEPGRMRYSEEAQKRDIAARQRVYRVLESVDPGFLETL